VINQSSQPWEGNLYTQLMRTDSPPPNNSGFMNLATYFGAAVSTPQKPFEKITFKEMNQKSLDQTVEGGWAAMIQHYFISAWIPEKSVTSTYYTKVLPNGLHAIGMIGKPVTAAPGTTVTSGATLYVGPSLGDQLEQAAPHLKLTIDYGWFWFISDIIFWMMQHIYDVVGNWGWSIVIVTIIIKLLFYQLSNNSYRSMSGLKKLQPRIELLKERYKDDKQKLTQATMELYKEAKVNPMSGCLPILIQIPVFIALYWVLVESVQLRQAPFIFWIHDLSQHDPYYILPVMMGISMFLQQRLNPPPPDPMQAKIMMLMPVLFTFLFANFPAGLMLYWFVNNTLSFLQQWHIMHRVEKENANKKFS
jgi:YidC/Oxa1 family membrane protein insertase